MLLIFEGTSLSLHSAHSTELAGVKQDLPYPCLCVNTATFPLQGMSSENRQDQFTKEFHTKELGLYLVVSRSPKSRAEAWLDLWFFLNNLSNNLNCCIR